MTCLQIVWSLPSVVERGETIGEERVPVLVTGGAPANEVANRYVALSQFEPGFHFYMCD
jgi:hypothetical protein